MAGLEWKRDVSAQFTEKIMPSILRIVFAVILALALPASAAEPRRVSDPDKLCQDVMQDISNKARPEAVDLIVNSIGKLDFSTTLANALQIFEGKNFDFTKKVVDKDYNGGLRQIVYY